MAETILLSVAANIIGTAVGLVCGKPYDSLINKLKEGDVANEKLHEIIVRDLTEIKAKLDCLSLKDLDSSYSFLKEGIELLNLAVKDQKSSDGQDEATGFSNDSASGILNAALSFPQAIQRLDISSQKRFIPAKDCFKASRETATHAFNNKSLSIKDRIMACKLRVAARILESGLEDPEVATTACLLSLEELHGLPAIQDMFSLYLNGGLRSKLKKAERLENIMSVLIINHALFNFAVKYSSQYPNVFTWPGIVLTGRTFNPILNTTQILRKTSVSEELLQQLNQTFDIPWSSYPRYIFAVNSRGEIIQHDYPHDNIIITYPTGESKSVVFTDACENRSVIHREVATVAVDSDDNVYVVCLLKIRREQNGSDKNYDHDFVLYVLDENYNFKLCRKFDFGKEKPEIGEFDTARIAVDKNKNIIMIKRNNNKVYVWDNTGQLKFIKFKVCRRMFRLSITSKNDIMIPSYDQHAVNLYTEEGTLKSTIKVPEGHNVCEVAFHHGMCKIIVFTYYVKEQYSYFLLCYSETGDLENSVFFCKRDRSNRAYTGIANHSCGLLAIMLDRRITFI